MSIYPHFPMKLRKWFIIFLIMPLAGCAGNLPSRGEPIRVASQRQTKIQEIPLETYLVGVLEKEVVGTWPIEALKAQAVASRTYALYRKQHPRDERFDVTSDTRDQVFQKKRRQSPAVVQAVLETEGETLNFNGGILQAFFHSCCGGMSEQADQVWQGITTPPLLTVHPDPFCSACPRSRWEYPISRKELEDRLRENGHPLKDGWKIEITKRDDSGRVLEIRFPDDGISFSGAKFREILGYTKLPSTLFEITDAEDPVVFVGRGSGHGVGLCQWGAKGMADEGKTYREILQFYYPGAEIAAAQTQERTDPSLPIPDLTSSEIDPE